MRTITKDEVLFTCELKLDRPAKLCLCKQSYSDGTCFYTLQDEMGNWKVEYGSRKLHEIIAQLEHETRIEVEYSSKDHVTNNPEVKRVIDEVIKWKRSIIKNIQDIERQAV